MHPSVAINIDLGLMVRAIYQSITEIHTVLAIFPLALDAAARVEVLPDGAKVRVACVESFALDAAPRLAGAFLAGWLYVATLNNSDVR